MGCFSLLNTKCTVVNVMITEISCTMHNRDCPLLPDFLKEHTPIHHLSRQSHLYKIPYKYIWVACTPVSKFQMYDYG